MVELLWEALHEKTSKLNSWRRKTESYLASFEVAKL
jgi:hypothetical protein